jgi:cytochrome c
MNAFPAACVAAAVITWAGNAWAADAKAGEALAKSNGCFACHTLDKKTVGPAYKDIAAKYRGAKGAEVELFKKVKAGGKGTWGDIPMPPNVHIKDDDIKAMVQWVLSIK